MGGCNNANYEWKSGDKRVRHEGGYLLGLAKSNYPFIKLNIKNKFRPDLCKVAMRRLAILTKAQRLTRKNAPKKAAKKVETPATESK